MKLPFSKRDSSDDELHEPNPITLLFPWLLSGYAWQLHGFWVGLLAYGTYKGILLVSNLLYFHRISKLNDETNCDPIRGFQRIKWAIFLVMGVSIALSGASTCTITTSGKEICHGLFSLGR